MFLFSVFFGCVLCMRKMFFQKEKCLFIRRLPSGGKKRMKKRRRIKKKKDITRKVKKKKWTIIHKTTTNKTEQRTEKEKLWTLKRKFNHESNECGDDCAKKRTRNFLFFFHSIQFPFYFIIMRYDRWGNFHFVQCLQTITKERRKLFFLLFFSIFNNNNKLRNN